VFRIHWFSEHAEVWTGWQAASSPSATVLVATACPIIGTLRVCNPYLRQPGDGSHEDCDNRDSDGTCDILKLRLGSRRR
jgi:hypothetical protein